MILKIMFFRWNASTSTSVSCWTSCTRSPSTTESNATPRTKRSSPGQSWSVILHKCYLHDVTVIFNTEFLMTYCENNVGIRTNSHANQGWFLVNVWYQQSRKNPKNPRPVGAPELLGIKERSEEWFGVRLGKVRF